MSVFLTRQRLCWTAIAVGIALLATGCLTQGEAPSLEEQAQGIDRVLICPVCPGETIDQSQVTLAKQMRALVREKLAAGESRQDILDFFVDRYGQDVLASPPKSGFNLLAWIVPVAGVLTAVVALGLILGRMRRGQALPETLSPTTQAPAELQPFLSQVDEEIRQVVEGGRPTSPPSPPAE